MATIAIRAVVIYEFMLGLVDHYPENPSPEVQQRTRNMLNNFIVGCSKCQYHYEQFLIQNPPRLKTQHEFYDWMVSYMNSINDMTGKPRMSVDEVKRRAVIKKTASHIYVLHQLPSGEIIDTKTFLPITTSQLQSQAILQQQQQQQKDTRGTNTTMNNNSDTDNSSSSSSSLVLLVFASLVVVVPLIWIYLAKWYG